ncbi:hypothetical protein FRB95_013936 [Tulasnella sp. JGI-2019a]|nr:hypothetical protein FRB93_005320 [Tulasnella sp. JGI-2019a]KAG9022939.1 hypothetical protein FRB95_013936 [Tulasnella sp. JGI-2019a]
MADLNYILALSPDLEVLALHDVHMAPTPSENGIQSMEPFSVFQLLEALKLVKIPMFAYDYLLSRLRFPHCQSIELEPDAPIPVEVIKGTVYRHDTSVFAQQAKSSLLLGETIYVSLGRYDGSRAVCVNTGGWTLGSGTTEDSDPGFSLALHPAVTSNPAAIVSVASQVTEFLRQACPTSPVQIHVELGLEAVHFPAVCLTGLNDMMVEKIFLDGDADIRSVMSYLGKRLESTSGEDGGWPYPRLTSICLTGSYGDQSVLTIRSWVQDRWVKFKDTGSGTRPKAYIEVTMPVRKGGRTEYWKPVLKKKKPGRRRPRVSEMVEWRRRLSLQ